MALAEGQYDWIDSPNLYKQQSEFILIHYDVQSNDDNLNAHLKIRKTDESNSHTLSQQDLWPTVSLELQSVVQVILHSQGVMSVRQRSMLAAGSYNVSQFWECVSKVESLIGKWMIGNAVVISGISLYSSWIVALILSDW